MTHQDYFRAVEFAKETADKVIEKIEQIAIENKIEAKITTEYIAEQNSFVIDVGNFPHKLLNDISLSMICGKAHYTSERSGYIIIEINL